MNTKKVNGLIRADRIKLVMPDGSMKGEIAKNEAIKIADDFNMDLVQVSQEPVPICKIMNYGKVRYKKSKRQKSNAGNNTTKEIRVSLNISEHDLNTKRRKIDKFLDKHFKVKYKLELKGRQRFLHDQALVTVNDQLIYFEEKAIWDEPKLSGNTVTTILTPS